MNVLELDINGARIFSLYSIDLPVLGQLKISETMIAKLDCYASDHRFVYLADT